MPASHDQATGLIVGRPSSRPSEEPRNSALFPHPNTADRQPRRDDEECYRSEDRIGTPWGVEVCSKRQSPENVEPSEHLPDRYLVHLAVLSLLEHLMHNT